MLPLSNPASASTSRSTSSRIAALLRLLFAVCLLTAILFYTLVEHDDPHRCKALLHEGNWLNRPDENGSRRPFNNWQPDGCMLRQYSSDDMHKCLGGRDVVISGDSTARQLFWAFSRMMNRDQAIADEKKKIPHHDDEAAYEDIHLIQYWNPYMETTADQVNHEFEITPGFRDQVELFVREREQHVPAAERKGPAFVILSSGPWFALTKWNDASIGDFKFAVDKLTDMLKLDNTTEFGAGPMDPVDGFGPDVYFAPPAPPFYDELPERKTSGAGIAPGEIEAIDDFLLEVEQERNLNLAKVFPKLSLNQREAIVDRLDTGFHVIDSVAEIKANILLNLRCNAMLDAQDGFPYDRTCCTDYGPRSSVQTAILALLVLYVIVCLVFELPESLIRIRKPQSPFLDMKVGVFGAALLLCYFADRTQLFAKGHRELVLSDTWTLIAITGVIGLVSVRKIQLRQPTKPAAAAVPLADSMGADIGVLSRDQTDEWKGWSQAVILAYHWTGASSYLPTYVLSRVLVASYLFQIGFTHTVYFLEKKDFSFRRVVAVLLRLNLLSCVLPYVMDTNYQFYYLAPLASFWFLVVYSALAWRSIHNDDTSHVLGKIGLLCFLAILLQFVPLWNWVFPILETVFNVHWGLHAWIFSVNLDGLIVFVGILAGVAYQRLERNRTWVTNYHTFIIPSIITIAMYGYYTAYLPSEQEYNRLHPYISILPIISFVFLRNATAPLRNRFSVAAAWLGRCYLETCIFQYHLLLAADTKGVLLLDMFRGGDGTLLSDRWRDLAVIIPIFLWLSHSVSEATSTIVMIVTRPQEIEGSLSNEDLAADLDGYISEPNYDEESKGKDVRKTSVINLLTRGSQTYLIGFIGGMWVLNWLY